MKQSFDELAVHSGRGRCAFLSARRVRAQALSKGGCGEVTHNDVEKGQQNKGNFFGPPAFHGGVGFENRQALGHGRPQAFGQEWSEPFASGQQFVLNQARKVGSKREPLHDRHNGFFWVGVTLRAVFDGLCEKGEKRTDPSMKNRCVKSIGAAATVRLA